MAYIIEIGQELVNQTLTDFFVCKGVGSRDFGAVGKYVECGKNFRLLHSNSDG